MLLKTRFLTTTTTWGKDYAEVIEKPRLLALG